MIPPVEERAVRPCITCIAGYDDDGTFECNLNETPFHLRYDRMIFDGVLGKFVSQTPDPYSPCKYHLRPEELKELIDSGRV